MDFENILEMSFHQLLYSSDYKMEDYKYKKLE